MDQEKSQQQRTAGDADKTRSKVAINSLIGMTANVVYLVSRLAITPFILVYVPLDQYGLWSVCFIIISYAGLSGFGVNNAYIKYVAQYRAEGNTDAINRLISTGVITMTLLCGVLYLVLHFAVPLLIEHFAIEPQLAKLAAWLILGSAGAFFIDLALGAFKATLEGLQEIALVRIVWLLSTLIEVALIFILLPLGIGVHALLYALVARYLLGIGAYLLFAFRRLPGFRLHPGLFSRTPLGVLFRFGSKVQSLGFIGVFMTTFDRIVTTALLGLEATGRFEVARKFPSMGASVSSAAFDAFLPAASSMGAWWSGPEAPGARQKLDKYLSLVLLAAVAGALTAAPALWWADPPWLPRPEGGGWLPAVLGVGAGVVLGGLLLQRCRRLFGQAERLHSDELSSLYTQGCRYVNLINTVLLSYLFAVAHPLIYAWVGPGFEDSSAIMMVLIASVWINLATGPGTSVMRGVDRTGRELEYALINLVLAALWIPALTALWGMVGAAAGTGLSTGVASLYFLWRTNQAFGYRLRDFALQTLAPCVAPLISAALLGAAVTLLPSASRWVVLGWLAAAGLLHLALCGLMLRAGLLTRQEWQTLTGFIARLKNRAR